MSCRYLVSKLVELGDGGEERWVYGYVCGKPTLDKVTSACEDHVHPRYSPFPAITKPRALKR